MANNDINRALLVVLDGVGVAPSGDNNGWSLADTPNIDLLFKDYPSTTIQASGESVGLPEGQMGNSEVGHMIIGSGTIFKQDLVIINESINEISNSDIYDFLILNDNVETALQDLKSVILDRCYPKDFVKRMTFSHVKKLLE